MQEDNWRRRRQRTEFHTQMQGERNDRREANCAARKTPAKLQHCERGAWSEEDEEARRNTGCERTTDQPDSTQKA